MRGSIIESEKVKTGKNETKGKVDRHHHRFNFSACVIDSFEPVKENQNEND